MNVSSMILLVQLKTFDFQANLGHIQGLDDKLRLSLKTSPNQSSGGKLFQCDQCDFVTESQRGLKVHVGKSHKSSDLPQQEKSRDSEKTAKHLEASPLKDFREELPNEFIKQNVPNP